MSKEGGIALSFDGKVTTVLLNSTTNGSADESTPASHHQFYGEIESRKNNGVIIVGHFESVAHLLHPVPRLVL